MSPSVRAERTSSAAPRSASGTLSKGPERSQVMPVFKSLALFAGASLAFGVDAIYPCARITRCVSRPTATRSHFLSLRPSVMLLEAKLSTSSNPSFN